MSPSAPPAAALRIGIDLGGTKIAGALLGAGGRPLAEHRMPAPRHDYGATIRAIAETVCTLERQAGVTGSIGIGIPGSVAPGSGLVQNANSTWLNGKPFARDLEAQLARPVRLANDANCFALSEAVDGAGAGARAVFGVILGTGCGGGLVFDGKLIDGPRGIGGEWGHNPLPWSGRGEHPGERCWCGRLGCLETWVSGTGLEADHARVTGERLSAEEIAARAGRGEASARATLDRHAGRLARGLAHVINIFDPDVIVLGGGLSKLAHLYEVVPALAAPYVFADPARVVIKPPVWGDAGGVRGAAWLWGGP
ncbi:MAG TPA: ROK family protein [Hyphomicrobiaceae bacterium]|nr:ROK family protein [Hyphomicrobiaceae bacterium]